MPLTDVKCRNAKGQIKPCKLSDGGGLHLLVKADGAIGRGVVDGVECEHLAFRNVDTDWQIWVELGARPIPHKYVITSKAVTGMPQYTLRIKEWRTDFPTDAFAFKPAQGAQKVALEALADTDEVPQGTVTTGEKK
jgi:hypothetical protein